MNEIIEKLLNTENSTRKMHRKLYAVLEIRLDFLIDLALFKLELKESPDLDLDLTDAQLIVYNNEIGALNVEISELMTDIETNVFWIDNL